MGRQQTARGTNDPVSTLGNQSAANSVNYYTGDSSSLTRRADLAHLTTLTLSRLINFLILTPYDKIFSIEYNDLVIYLGNFAHALVSGIISFFF